MLQITSGSNQHGAGPTNEGWRDVQSAMRVLKSIRGLTPQSGPATLYARPVLGTDAVERGTILPRLLSRDSDGLRQIDIPTGPRPTFQQTPLEKMRVDALRPPKTFPETKGPEKPAENADQQASNETAPQRSTTPASSDIAPMDAYNGLRRLELPSSSGRQIDTVK